MSPLLQTHSRCAQRPFRSRLATVLAIACSAVVSGCGALACPESLTDVDGTCQQADPGTDREPEPGAVEQCDGLDNDGDNAVDEGWPQLGEPCVGGPGVGACLAGQYACAEGGLGIVCEGAVGPSDEVCDAKDNDCDGLVDEGVLSTKSDSFDDHASVTAIDGGFVVSRIVADQLRVETYDTGGNRTGYHDDTEGPSSTVFLESDAAGRRVLVAMGQYAFEVVDVYVGSDLVPVIIEAQALHEGWKQGTTLGVYDPPFHPRVLAAPSRFIGYRDVITFALNPFANNSLTGLARAPTVAWEVPLYSVFDAAGAFVVWEQGDNLRAGWLQDDGALLLDIDVARGSTPGIAMGDGGPGLVYLQDEVLRLSELGGLTLQCTAEGFCNERIGSEVAQQVPGVPMALGYHEAADTWFIVAGTQLMVVGRGDDGAVVVQEVALEALADPPNRVDVVVSGGTAAVVQATADGTSALTFLGCF
jgi:hypothetical protein